MDIKGAINFLEENKSKLGETSLGFGNYIVYLDLSGNYVMSREIGGSDKFGLVLPILEEKDWNTFLKKVEEEITPKIIDEKIVSNEYLEKLLGMNEKQASEKIKSDGFILRVVQKDGESFIITDDLRQDRVNLTISNNKVVEAHRG